MRVKKNSVLIPIILILILAIAVPTYTHYYNNKFIEKCADLNGKDLSFENLSKLEGRVYSHIPPMAVGVYPLEEKHISQYRESFDKPLENGAEHIKVNDDKSISITKGERVSGDWICNIKLGSDQKLMTKSYYLF